MISKVVWEMWGFDYFIGTFETSKLGTFNNNGHTDFTARCIANSKSIVTYYFGLDIRLKFCMALILIYNKTSWYVSVDLLFKIQNTYGT